VQLLQDVAPALKAGQSFQIFSGFRPGAVTESGTPSLHGAEHGSAVDVRIVDAQGRPVDTGIVGRPSMGGGLPGPEIDNAMIAAARARGYDISVGGLFSGASYDPGHYGIGRQFGEVRSNLARQAAAVGADASVTLPEVVNPRGTDERGRN